MKVYELISMLQTDNESANTTIKFINPEGIEGKIEHSSLDIATNTLVITMVKSNEH